MIRNLLGRQNILIGGFLVLLIVIGNVSYQQYQLHVQVQRLSTDYEELTTESGDLVDAYNEALFEDHLHYLEIRKLEAARLQIEEAYNTLTSEESAQQQERIQTLYEQYQSVLKDVERNAGVGLDTNEISSQLGAWGTLFLEKNYDELAQKLAEADSSLDDEYEKYLAALPTPTPVPTIAPTVPPANNPPVAAATGYSFQTVGTSRGSFSVYLIKLPLGSYTVKTVAANTSDCTDNCPAKSLAQYVSENNAYAGIHGTYFCPPDYAACSGKVNSYDYAVFDSNTKSWRNEHTLQWYKNGLAAFNGHNHLFYDDIQQYYFQHGGGGVTAALSNFPSLVKNGQVIVDEGELDSYQRTAKGARGAIGVNGSHMFLAIATGATVPDMAYIMQALGVDHALNLDGGGSSALYIDGSYKVGPGRALPNAIVVVRG